MLTILQKRTSHVSQHNSAMSDYFYFDHFERSEDNRVSYLLIDKYPRPRSMPSSISSLWRRRRSSSSDRSTPSLSTSSTASSVIDPEDVVRTSAKVRELEELLAVHPERTVKLSITPKWAA